MAKGVHGTTSIEGNTFSEEEVEKIIRKELDVAPSREYQEQQVNNMLMAFSLAQEIEMQPSNEPFSIDLFNYYHNVILKDLEGSLPKDVVVGAIRTHSVTVDRYRGAPPEQCERLLSDLADWLNQDSGAPKGYEMAWEILRALVAHVYFAWIHPYGDGNGRMARLLEFIVLVRAGVPDIAAHLLSNHYNKTRDMYYLRLQESHGEWHNGAYPPHGDVTEFILYALQGFKDELDEQIRYIQIMQLNTIWHDHIHKEFRGLNKQVDQRRKRLILDVSDGANITDFQASDVRDISPAVAVLYNKVQDRTIKRDLDKLIEMGLLVYQNGSYGINFTRIVGFLPRARNIGQQETSE